MSGLPTPFEDLPPVLRQPEQPAEHLRNSLVLLGALRRSLSDTAREQREALEKMLPAVRVAIAACALGHLEGRADYWEAVEQRVEAALAHSRIDEEPEELLRALTARVSTALDQLDGRAP